MIGSTPTLQTSAGAAAALMNPTNASGGLLSYSLLGSSGATIPLNNGINTESGPWAFAGGIASGLTPTTDNAYSLGTTAARWSNVDTVGLTASTLTMTANPSLTYPWAGVTTYTSSLRNVLGTNASAPEIMNISIMNATAGGSNPTAYFKAVDGRVCSTWPGSASCWVENDVLNLSAGSGAVGGIGMEYDVDNFNKDYTSAGDNPMAVGTIYTGSVTNQYYADFAITISGSSAQWWDGIQASSFTHAPATVTISIANPAVISQASHGYVAGQPVVFTTTGALPSAITAGTRYYVLAAGLTTGSYEISATPGGTPVSTAGETQSGVLTSAGANVFGHSFIFDDSNSPTALLVKGSHTTVIDMSGATCTGYQMNAVGLYIDCGGNLASIFGAFGTLAASNTFLMNGKTLISSTAPTFASGACSGSIGAANTTAAFTVNTGSGTCSSTFALGMPNAANGWTCTAYDEAGGANFRVQATADTATSVTFTGYSIASPSAANFIASHTVHVMCLAN